jgi:Tol biopolymer transport system component
VLSVRSALTVRARLRGGILVAAVVFLGCTVERLPVGNSPAFLRVESFVRLTDLPATSPPAWSPDGEWLAISTRDAVWLVRADRRGERRLASLPLTSQVSWAPDGRALAVVADGSLYAVSPEGMPPLRLSGDRRVRQCAWAPRGDTIAYIASGPGQDEAWLVHEDGSAETRVPDPLPGGGSREEARTLSWAPDGGSLWIAWGPPSGVRVDRVVEVAARRSGGIPLSLPLREQAAFPAFSPSGRFLAYLGGLEAQVRAGVGQVTVVRTDGTGRRVLTPPGTYSGLAWAPGGSLLAFAGAEGESLSVVVADALTGERLTVADYHPEMSRRAGPAAVAWSPDGLHIAIGAGRGAVASPVWIVTLERL